MLSSLMRVPTLLHIVIEKPVPMSFYAKNSGERLSGVMSDKPVDHQDPNEDSNLAHCR